MRRNLFEKTDHILALELLKEGNRRYVEGKSHAIADTSETRRSLAEKGQVPFAVILGCSDSRVPPEVIFDYSKGQIFIVRTAGNVADAIAIGSVEYAVEYLHAKLVVVLGHSKCGAVAAAVSGEDYGPNIGAIIAEIEPSLNKVRSDMDGDDESEDISCKCEDENIRRTADKLAQSDILDKHIADGSLKIVCAKYGLETGEVSFFE
jgi:carbonic anhydrase